MNIEIVEPAENPFCPPRGKWDSGGEQCYEFKNQKHTKNMHL